MYRRSLGFVLCLLVVSIGCLSVCLCLTKLNGRVCYFRGDPTGKKVGIIFDGQFDTIKIILEPLG